MTWNLFLDDDSEHRFPETFYQDCRVFIICRNIEEAKSFVDLLGMPEFMSLDHDLGGEDTAIVFLKWLANEYWDGKAPVPNYKIHSANPVGQQNILSFMESWKRATSSD